MARLIFIVVFIALFALNTLQERGFRKRGLDTDGERPVDRRLFLLGKVSTLLCCLAAFAQAIGLNVRLVVVPRALENLAAVLFMAGFVLLWAAFRDLGDANTTGLPARPTELRTAGVYAWSRNPLYAGLYLMTAGAVIYCGCVVILALGIAAVAAHHRIVLAEERFLEARFGQAYLDYRKNTRRYL